MPRRRLGLGLAGLWGSCSVSRLSCLGLLLFLVSRLSASSWGLIDQPQTFPWTVGLTPVVQEEAGGLDPGESRIRSSVLWFNTYRQYGIDQTMEQRIDMEGLLATTSGAWSPAPGWELRAQVQGWSLGGGFMDYFLSGFHGAISVPDQGRNQTGENEYRDYLKGIFDDRSPATGLTQASFGVRGFSGPWSWSGWAKIPVPRHQGWGWSHRWGGGSSVSWGEVWPWPQPGLKFGAGLTAALVAVGPDSSVPGEKGPFTVQGAGYVAVGGQGWRALVQANWTGVNRDGGGYLSQGAGLLTLGCQVPLDSRWLLEGAVTEEFLTWATMEVGFQAGIAWKF